MKRSAVILSLAPALAGLGAWALLGGCARVAVEGGDKPIHIVMDINIKIDQKLDQFFAFEEQAVPATRPTETAAASVTTGVPNAPTTGGVQ